MVPFLRMVRTELERKDRNMARTRRIKRDGEAHYHLMSRTNDRRFLFEKGRVKRELVTLLRKAAEFSGVKLEAYCVMDDHFHVVCKVGNADSPVPETEVLRRIAVLKGGRFAAELAEHWSDLRLGGLSAAADAALESWRARMHDVSQFAKTFKELVNVAYKAFLKASEGSVPAGKPVYCGSLWSGRFKSTLVEGGCYLATCVRYVELNPVRAGMVRRAKDYAYSSANDAKPDEIERSRGSVPDGRLMRRVAQVGNGKIFGSYAFVTEAIVGFGSFFAGRPAARAVFAGVDEGLSLERRLEACGVLEAYASHGWMAA